MPKKCPAEGLFKTYPDYVENLAFQPSESLQF